MNSKYFGESRVVIPSDIQRDKYIRKCYDTGRISVFTFGSGSIRNMSVCKHVMNDIVFPESPDKYGSVVVYNKLPNREEYICIGVINDLDDIFDTTEYQFSVGRKSADGVSLISGDADDGTLTVTVNHNSNGGKLTINIGKDGTDSYFSLDVAGLLKTEANDMEALAYDSIKFTLPKDSTSEVTSISYVKGTGFSYSDEFGNEENITVNSHKINHKKVIILGEDTDNAMLYSQFKSFMTQLIQQLGASTVAVSAFGTYPLVNAALIEEFIVTLNEDIIKSEYVKLK